VTITARELNRATLARQLLLGREPLGVADGVRRLLALQAQQLADLTAVVAANGRAQAMQSAEQAAAAEQGREQRRRFLMPGTSYQPGNARMFPNGN